MENTNSQIQETQSSKNTNHKEIQCRDQIIENQR